MQVEVTVKCLDLRQDVSELMTLQPAEFSELEHGQTVVCDARDVAGVVDHEHGDLGKALTENVLKVSDVLRRRVVDEDDDPRAVRLQRSHGLHSGHEVGGRLIGERHDADVGHLRGFDHAAFDEASEVENKRLALEARGSGFQRLTRLESRDAPSWKSRFIDISSPVVEVIGDQHTTAVFGVADGVGRFTLPSFDRVEKHGHDAIVIG